MLDDWFIILVWFLSYTNMKNHRCTYVPFLSLPTQCHPSRLLQSPILSSLSHTANSTGYLFTYVTVYASTILSPFISPFPSSSPPLSEVSSLCLCLHCCSANRFISTILLDSIYMSFIRYWFFSFWLISLRIIGSGFIHLIRNDSNVFLFTADYYSIV